MTTKGDKTRKIGRQLTIRIVFFILLSCLIFFLPARTLKFYEAWGYIAIILTCAVIAIVYFLKHDPDLLERRLRTREKVKEQKWIIKIGSVLFIPTFIIPGFDKYNGWSDIPLVLVIISDIIILLSYLLVLRVFKENSYASRVVEINTDQRVISTGPYSYVRHPMYTGVLLMYGFTPLALGSYWALTGTFFLVAVIVFRIFSEEKFLAENLDGYKEYLLKIRYRIIPGIW